MIQIKIRWGELFEPDERPTETFRFKTRAEANAFMTGVVSAEGWMGYDLIEDGRDEQAGAADEAGCWVCAQCGQWVPLESQYCECEDSEEAE